MLGRLKKRNMDMSGLEPGYAGYERHRRPIVLLNDYENAAG